MFCVGTILIFDFKIFGKNHYSHQICSKKCFSSTEWHFHNCTVHFFSSAFEAMSVWIKNILRGKLRFSLGTRIYKSKQKTGTFHHQHFSQGVIRKQKQFTDISHSKFWSRKSSYASVKAENIHKSVDTSSFSANFISNRIITQSRRIDCFENAPT